MNADTNTVIVCITVSIISALLMFYQLIMYLRLHKSSRPLMKAYEPIERNRNKLKEKELEYKQLQKNYRDDHEHLASLQNFLSLYRLGVGSTDQIAYERNRGDSTLEEVENELKHVKETAKALVKNKRACICSMGDNVVVNNRRASAKALFNREIKLRLRCFDNEVKSAIVLADWNNINRLISRITDSFHEINSTGKIVKTYIQPEYLDIRIKELKLTYEISQLKLEIKEDEQERRRFEKEAEREEKKIKTAAEKAEKLQKRMEALVEKELASLDQSNEEQRNLLALHQQELELLKERARRAISMAQITRAGFVYIISNNKSFGPGVVKIGMTRRVDPNERVRELSDASVPELFDVHRFYFTKDAPKMEKELHQLFSRQRMNLTNRRKEFFLISPEEAIMQADKYEDTEITSEY